MYKVTVCGNTLAELYTNMYQLVEELTPKTEQSESTPARSKGKAAKVTVPESVTAAIPIEPIPAIPSIAADLPPVPVVPSIIADATPITPVVVPTVNTAPIPIAVPTVVPTASTVPIAAPVPTVAPTYTFDQIAKAGAALAQNGKMTEAMELLTKYNIQTLTQLPETQYGAFATELRALGANI